jgi:integrase/recombinase XerD
MGMPTATAPMPRNSVQDALHAALRDSGIHKRASVHTFRPSWATHLLEAGVNLRLIQAYLGHNSSSTTALSPHLTAKAEAMATAAIHNLMEAL